ncbi:tyrosine-protein kinase Etk/Wzc [Paraburkholderia tropica]|uniref:polysaccharide biosynthesis tyrosine autokinase n=1 Tax=Paraburkholderia tropica TaxID=92647 RepID=UPI00178EAC36|nr:MULTISPECIES: polysaccharide biosynthesis tyrosine autokinase [Paraburkholderia]MBB3003261.1 tyrosine-protein kinase Etk/Wzc [Paraburkholderia tropica]MBB6322277.1 tyrosine-protein kinase Etk/Wzc [Paraburkholderia tropica]
MSDSMHWPTENPKSNAESGSNNDFVATLDMLFDSRWLIAITAMCFLLLGGAYAFIAQPIYRANILVQVQDSPDSNATRGLLGDVSSLFNVKSSAAAETQILASRLVISRTVDNLNLQITAEPHWLPVLGQWISRHNQKLSSPGLLGFGGYTWGNESIAVSRFDVPVKFQGDKFWVTMLGPNHYQLSGADLDRAFEGKTGRLETFMTADGPILLSIDSLFARSGAKFKLIRQSRLETIEDIQKALDVQERVKQSDVMVASLEDTDPQRVADTLNEIGSQYLRQNVERKSAEAAQSIRFLNEQIPHLRDQLTAAEDSLTSFNIEHGAVDLTEQAKLTLAKSADASARLLELQQKRQELLSRYTAQHPAVVALDEQISTLNAYNGEAHREIRDLPQLQQESVRRMLDVKVNTDLYTALLNNVAQLQLIRAGKVGDVRLVDRAVVPEKRVKPKRLLICVAALMLGVLAGCCLAIIRSMLFRGITDPHEVEQFLSIPVCATVPRSVVLKNLMKMRGPGVLLASAVPDDPAVESLRSLRTSILIGIQSAKNNVLLVTGPTPGIGKSFISANLANVIAQAGKRVILVDADLRKGHLHKTLGIERGVGLSELVLGSASEASAIHRQVCDRLDFISTGARPSNPAEMLASKRIAQLIARLSSEYDIVLIDSPPVLAVSDTEALAINAGTTLIVAHSGITRLGEIAETVKRLTTSDIRVSGIVFNGVNPRSPLSLYGSKHGAYRYVAYKYDTDGDE